MLSATEIRSGVGAELCPAHAFRGMAVEIPTVAEKRRTRVAECMLWGGLVNAE
jgi:hypothetical protein